jgi:hypothetical protein
MNIKVKLTNLNYFFILITLFLIFCLFYTGIIHRFYVPLDENFFLRKDIKFYSNLKIFGDTQTIFLFAECYNAGFDVYIRNTCAEEYGFKYTNFQYGRLLLLLPVISNNFREIFFITYGTVLIFTLVFLTYKIIRPKSFFDNVLCLIILTNPAILLLFERLNFDLLIFLILILVVYINKKFIFKTILVFLSFAMKFYPAIFIIIFFLEQNLKLKRKLAYLFFFFLFILLYLFLYYDDFVKISEDIYKIGRNIRYSFSINGLIRVIDYVYPVNTNLIKIFLVLLLIVKVILCNFFYSKKIYLKLEFDKKEFLFLISANLIIIVYFFFNNNYFREVFFIGLIPFLLNSEKSHTFSKLILSIIIMKYIFMIITWPFLPLSNQDLNYFSKFIVGLKIFADYFIILLLSILVARLNILVIKINFFKLNAIKF